MVSGLQIPAMTCGAGDVGDPLLVVIPKPSEKSAFRSNSAMPSLPRDAGDDVRCRRSVAPCDSEAQRGIWREAPQGRLTIARHVSAGKRHNPRFSPEAGVPG